MQNGDLIVRGKRVDETSFDDFTSVDFNNWMEECVKEYCNKFKKYRIFMGTNYLAEIFDTVFVYNILEQKQKFRDMEEIEIKQRELNHLQRRIDELKIKHNLK